MFDWNDEELTNIIWGEADESDDHIVPYQEAIEAYCKKKEWSHKAGNIKSAEQKAPGDKVDIHGRKLESSSSFDHSEGTSAPGLGMDSWPNLSLSNAVKTEQNSLDTSVSNNLTEITNFDSFGGAETAQLDKDTEIFCDPHGGKEQGDFDDYGWASIGSFDDLDRIFSNDDPIFGNADELWSSSKDVMNSPIKSFPLSVGSRTEHAQEDGQLFTPGFGKLNNTDQQNVGTILDHVEYAGRESKPIVKKQTDLTIVGKNAVGNCQVTADNALPNKLAEKVYKQKKLFRSRKKLEEQSELKLQQNLYGDWSSYGNQASQFRNHFATPTIRSCPSSVLSQQKQLQGPEQLEYQQISNPYVAASAYGSISNPYSAMPMLSHIQSGEFKHPPLLSGYEVSSGNANPVNKLSDSLVKPQSMTPQEKIEKLRRRQQIQAMLAIQKQRQQFGHQVSCGDQSMTQKYSQENQIQHVEGADLEVEDLSTLPPFDPNSPLEQDDSNTISLAVNDYSVEDTLFYRLQDIIAKLDVRIRLCIRDSLFRLAQSAMQRHYASDAGSTNNGSKDQQVVVIEETSSHNRNTTMPEVETETNPIDRTVAQLLFHRPLELLGNHLDTPESPVSFKLLCEPKTVGTANLSMGCLPETLKHEHNFSHKRSINCCTLADPQAATQYKINLCLDSLENVSNNRPADEEGREIEASQRKKMPTKIL